MKKNTCEWNWIKLEWKTEKFKVNSNLKLETNKRIIEAIVPQSNSFPLHCHHLCDSTQYVWLHYLVFALHAMWSNKMERAYIFMEYTKNVIGQAISSIWMRNLRTKSSQFQINIEQQQQQQHRLSVLYTMKCARARTLAHSWSLILRKSHNGQNEWTWNRSSTRVNTLVYIQYKRQITDHRCYMASFFHLFFAY